jgi:hypothetical protein
MMQKSLQILFGLLLILVLAYVAFLDVSKKVKDDLLIKAKVMFSENNVRGVTANIQGEGLEMSRSLVLTGTAISEVERVRIVTLIENIEGVCRVDNQIRLYPVVPKVPTVITVPVVKTSADAVRAKTILKELAVMKSSEKKSTTEMLVEKKEPTLSVSSPTTTEKVPLVPVVENNAVITSVSSTKMTIKVPSVPAVGNQSIIVPRPVKVISTPKVIEVEKIKLEGVK